MSTRDEPLCPAKQHGRICTLPAGHAGRHVAEGSQADSHSRPYSWEQPPTPAAPEGPREHAADCFRSKHGWGVCNCPDEPRCTCGHSKREHPQGPCKGWVKEGCSGWCRCAAFEAQPPAPTPPVGLEAVVRFRDSYPQDSSEWFALEAFRILHEAAVRQPPEDGAGAWRANVDEAALAMLAHESTAAALREIAAALDEHCGAVPKGEVYAVGLRGVAGMLARLLPTPPQGAETP